MPKISQLGARRTMTVDYDGESIDVTFRPAAINDNWVDRLQGLDKEDRQGYMELLCEALIAWDILDEDGQPLPPTVELMRALPLDLLYQITWDLFESLTPKKRSSRLSGAG